MLHNEHFKKADTNYELRHDDKGNAIHVYIKDGYANIYRTLEDFIDREVLGKEVEDYITCNMDEDLDRFYAEYGYTWEDAKLFEEILCKKKS